MLQQSRRSQGSFFRAVVGTLQNVLDTRQSTYRIVRRALVKGRPSRCVAVADAHEEIEKDWKWIEDHLLPLLNDLEPAEREHFIDIKLGSMVAAIGAWRTAL